MFAVLAAVLLCSFLLEKLLSPAGDAAVHAVERSHLDRAANSQ